ncbi:HlyD family efflux transporter periplasmic adaptor subunit [Halomonas denitrificans]|uniref:HlyD family efflux transporter periplasmic adaptor subunit n=1 Tax=Halomonas denitrificans TaxID=370769 RepID=UPI000D3DABD6|nr:HlyD family efflux transporter periplasmic adaptor subunit [Halomonas denitrificans]
MSDHHSDMHDIDRHEPTLGPDGPRGNGASGRSSGQHDAPTDQIRHERRDERRFIRVTPPFRVRFEDGQELTGADVSVGGFAVRTSRPMRPGEQRSASLLLTAGATELIVPVRAECRHATADGRQHVNGFEITDIDPPHRELLRQVVRSCLTGRQANIEALMEGEDAQTPRKRRAKASTPQPTSRPPKPRGRYLLLFTAIAILAVVAAATAYRNFMLIEPSFAAVTAPRIDIRAPNPGIVEAHDLQAGDRVERDQPLTSIANSDLESELILSKAALRYNDQLISNLQEHLESAGGGPVSIASSARPESGEAMNFETVSPEIARARIDQFKTARDLESSRITALEARQSSNDIFSPCNCLVAWALSSADGTYVNESERIMTLIRTGEDDVMVEALVHMDDIARIEPNQTAYVSLPNASTPIRARVRNVALDIERQPRAGFPRWVRQQQNVASVLLVPEETLPAESVGKPVDVRFTEAPMLGATAEWVWQGVRAVIQFGDRLYRTAISEEPTQGTG